MAGTGGKREGSGRKSKAQELGLSALIDEVCNIEQQKEIIRKLAEDSLSDDFFQRSESRKLLLAYKFGKPPQNVNIGNQNDQPVKVVVEYVTKK